mmetsp:Transcript_44499/g.139577  ORF Transcript_44499/g.139577 Transcript_44499/m.139577 type:complete len:376 (-) Transcript_44499:2536-3663(-)
MGGRSTNIRKSLATRSSSKVPSLLKEMTSSESSSKARRALCTTSSFVWSRTRSIDRLIARPADLLTPSAEAAADKTERHRFASIVSDLASTSATKMELSNEAAVLMTSLVGSPRAAPDSPPSAPSEGPVALPNLFLSSFASASSRLKRVALSRAVQVLSQATTFERRSAAASDRRASTNGAPASVSSLLASRLRSNPSCRMCVKDLHAASSTPSLSLSASPTAAHPSKISAVRSTSAKGALPSSRATELGLADRIPVRRQYSGEVSVQCTPLGNDPTASRATVLRNFSARISSGDDPAIAGSSDPARCARSLMALSQSRRRQRTGSENISAVAENAFLSASIVLLVCHASSADPSSAPRSVNIAFVSCLRITDRL